MWNVYYDNAVYKEKQLHPELAVFSALPPEAVWEVPFFDTCSTEMIEKMQSRYRKFAKKSIVLSKPSIACINALMMAANGEAAVGEQRDANGNISYTYAEFKNSAGQQELWMYSRDKGTLMATKVVGEKYKQVTLSEREVPVGLWLCLMAPELIIEIPRSYETLDYTEKQLDMELSGHLRIFMDAKEDNFKDKDFQKIACLCFFVISGNILIRTMYECDERYRGTEDFYELLPLQDDMVITNITQTMIKSNPSMFKMTNSIGEFTLLGNRKEKLKKEQKTIAEMKNLFATGESVEKKYEPYMMAFPEELTVPSFLESMCMAYASGSRLMSLDGPSGTGKSTAARMLAQVLGLPYMTVPCNPTSDFLELTEKFVPRISVSPSEKAAGEAFLSAVQEAQFMPAAALQEYTGEEVDDSIGTDEAVRRIFDWYQKKQEEDSDFTVVETAVVETAQELQPDGTWSDGQAAVIEFPEVNMIESPAVMTTFNSLFDENGFIRLTSGKVKRLHPATVVIYTLNPEYEGATPLNQSVIDRITHSESVAKMTSAEMLSIVSAKLQLPKKDLLYGVAKTLCAIAAKISEINTTDMLGLSETGIRSVLPAVKMAQTVAKMNGNITITAEEMVIKKFLNKATFNPDLKKEVLDRLAEGSKLMTKLDEQLAQLLSTDQT